ncbi:uncharacterized protein LOC108488133 [Gossypium arboreum]|uniref:uncharacterized protein LOC108488133 n=1 Tax=Gossypium arboreum TaxID=29729 RepID=UPI00081937DE|nr:uncharacterized protein LOC108488133 [Gossypium arboreum]
MAPYEALYGRRCRTPLCWTQLGERRVLGPKLVSNTKNKVRLIQDKLKAALDRQKSCTNLKRKEIEYSVGNFVFLNVSPWNKVLRFGCKERILCHVSKLKRYRSDHAHIVPIEKVEVRPDLTFEEELVQILNREDICFGGSVLKGNKPSTGSSAGNTA